MNLFKGFTTEEFGKLKNEINDLLKDLTPAFQNVLNKFESKSKIIYEKTYSSSDAAVSSATTQITPITFQAWSETYDEMYHLHVFLGR